MIEYMQGMDQGRVYGDSEREIVDLAAIPHRDDYLGGYDRLYHVEKVCLIINASPEVCAVVQVK